MENIYLCSSYNYSRHTVNRNKEVTKPCIFSIMDLGLDLASETSLEDFFDQAKLMVLKTLAVKGDIVRWKQAAPLGKTQRQILAP